MSIKGAPKRLRDSREAGFDTIRDASKDILEVNLRSTLFNMARLLVASGYSHSRINSLLKLAFVNAAADVDRDAGKKENIARIAASTGLTRIEVSNLLRLHKDRQFIVHSPNRALRVARGWKADRQFVDSNGRPRDLPFSAKRQSFSALAKRYSGDIPARAILREMLRLGLAVQSASGSIKLLRTDVRIPRKTISAMRAISPWIDSLWSAVRMDEHSDLRSSTYRINLNFDSFPQVMATLREFDARTNAFVRSVAELGIKRQKSNAHGVRITIAVAATKPTGPNPSRKSQLRK